MSFVLTTESFRRAKMTQILLILNVGCFIAINIITDAILGLNILLDMAMNRYIIDNNLEFWRFFTAFFFHWDGLHLFSNMLGLFVFGTSMEQNYKRGQYLLIYLLAGLTGNFFSYLIDPIFVYSLGASGAIFGLMGAVFVATAKQNQSMLIYGLIFIVYDLYMSFAPGIGTWAHIFGLLVGLIGGFVIWRRNYSNTQRDFNTRPRKLR